jgi:hypothetical protein
MRYATWLGQVVAAGKASNPVIIIDEFDVLHECSADVRDLILSGLRAFVTAPFEKRPARGIVLCGPYKMTTLAMSNPETMSPFNVKTRVPMTPFTLDEVRAMFDAYVQEWWSGSVSVSDDVVSAIFTDTAGHKGWTVTAAARVHKAIKLGNIKGEFGLVAWTGQRSQYESDLNDTIIGHAVQYASGILANGGGAGAGGPGAAGGGGGVGGPGVGAADAGAGVNELVLATLRAVASGARKAVRVANNAGVEDALTPVCRSLVSLGVLAVHEGEGGPVTLGAPIAVRLVRAATHAGIRVPSAPSCVYEDGVALEVVLVQAILASHAGVLASGFRGKSRTPTVQTPVPPEACYDANLSAVLRQWFGSENVDVQGPAGAGAVDQVFRLRKRLPWTLVELVCHEKPGKPSSGSGPKRKQSVGAHVLRAVKYLEAYPTSLAFLINYDVEGEAPKLEVLSADHAKPLHRLHVVLSADLTVIRSIQHWAKEATVPALMHSA